MTDKEIIKALECCANEDCDNCPNAIGMFCGYELSAPALDLIKRQQQDISTLKTKCYCISIDRDRIKKRLEVVSRDLQEGSARLTEAEREKFWKTSDDFINRQQAKIEDLTERLEAAIAGQESLQKALAEKDREVAELNSDLKLLRNDYDHLKKNFDETVEKNKRLRDKVVGLTAEKDRLIETFGECQERAVKDFAKAVIGGLTDGRISRMFDMVDFTTDYLRGKMVGDTE